MCNRGHKFNKSSDCPICPICWPKCYRDKTQTNFSKLSTPASRALQNSGITKLKDLNNVSEEELLALHGFGPHSISAIKNTYRKRSNI